MSQTFTFDSDGNHRLNVAPGVTGPDGISLLFTITGTQSGVLAVNTAPPGFAVSLTNIGYLNGSLVAQSAGTAITASGLAYVSNANAANDLYLVLNHTSGSTVVLVGPASIGGSVGSGGETPAADVTAGTFGANTGATGAYAFPGAGSAGTSFSAATLAATTSVTVTSASAVALAAGLAGATNPAFVVDASTASQAAGVKVTGAVAAGTVAVAVISSGADANLTLNAKGTGTIGIGTVSTGAVTVTPAATLSNTVTASGTVTAAQLVSVAGTVTATAGASRGQRISTSITAAANADVLYGLDVAPTVVPGAFTGLTMAGVRVANNATAMTGTKYGMLVAAQSGGTVANHGVYSQGSIVSDSATAGVGYATGAGGAQTQATNKQTTVVSNTITTAITMNNEQLNLLTITSFTFTNSTIAATDTVICTHQSAGTSGAYTINAFPGAGSAVISVRNNTAGNLSEAIVIRVTVIKSVSA